MKPFLLIFFIAMVGCFTACRENKCPVEDVPLNTKLELNFRAEAAGAPIWFYKGLDYPLENLPFRITLLRFFVGDVTLLGTDGDTTVLDIADLDFSLNQGAEATAAEGQSIVIANPPVGTYTGIRFGVGVPGDLNRMAPAEFLAGHPLSNPAEYWEAWQSYIFAKIEGQADANANGDYSDDNVSFLYHSGTQGQYVTLDFDRPIEIKGCETTRLDFGLDVPRLFYNDTDTLDILNNNFQHTGNPDDPNYDITYFLMQNFGGALQLKN